HVAIGIFFLIIYVALLQYALWVPIHWDEGWNLCAAKNWSLNGHAGCSLSGRFTSPRLGTGDWPIFLSKALFDLFGVFFFWPRALIVLVACGSLFVLFHLSSVLYTKRSGYVSVVLYILVCSDPRIHPFGLASQGYVEILLIFALLLFLFLLTKLIPLRTGPSLLLWFLLLILIIPLLQFKIQARPFLYSLFISSAAFLFFQKRYFKSLLFALFVPIGYFGISHFAFIQPPYLQTGVTLEGVGTEGFYELLGLNLNPHVRLAVTVFFFKYFWLFSFVLFTAINAIKNLRFEYFGNSESSRAVGFGIFFSAGLWTLWFICLSIDFPRYYAVAVPILCVTSAGWLSKKTNDFSWTYLHDIFVIRNRSLNGLLRTVFWLSCITYGSIQIILTPFNLFHFGWDLRDENADIFRVAQFINRHSPPGSLVETYDSQFYHLLQRPFHYPQDQMNVDRIAERLDPTRPKTLYDYEKLKPDYVIVGPWSLQVFKLYADIDNNPNYSLVLVKGHYSVYQRNYSSSLSDPQSGSISETEQQRSIQ
ncbi:MAG: hypothetical protein KDD55_05260, partial [Bdellovibrionales bacterium]|nr:hypothetical protein [Bdellovibrionales bacterium]